MTSLLSCHDQPAVAGMDVDVIDEPIPVERRYGRRLVVGPLQNERHHVRSIHLVRLDIEARPGVRLVINGSDKVTFARSFAWQVDMHFLVAGQQGRGDAGKALERNFQRCVPDRPGIGDRGPVPTLKQWVSTARRGIKGDFCGAYSARIIGQKNPWTPDQTWFKRGYEEHRSNRWPLYWSAQLNKPYFNGKTWFNPGN